jgi:four helix bundle protein
MAGPAGEHIQFLGHARGSICELQTQLIIATGLEFGESISRKPTEDLTGEVSRMLVALMKKLQV